MDVALKVFAAVLVIMGATGLIRITTQLIKLNGVFSLEAVLYGSFNIKHEDEDIKLRIVGLYVVSILFLGLGIFLLTS